LVRGRQKIKVLPLQFHQNKSHWDSDGVKIVLGDSDSDGEISEESDDEEQLEDFEFDKIIQHFEFLAMESSK
jgi:hypothetical protein